MLGKKGVAAGVDNFHIELVQVDKFAFAQKLHPLVVKHIIKSGELQPRAVDIYAGNENLRRVPGNVGDLQVKILDDLL